MECEFFGKLGQEMAREFAMKRKRFSVEQIVAVLKQAAAGLPVSDLIRQVGISEQTYYRWKKQYAGLQSDQVRELKLLQDENARLKKLVAELSLDKAILQDVNSKNGPARAEETRGRIHPGPLWDLTATGLPDREASSKCVPLPQCHGPQDRIASTHATTRACARAFRLSTDSCSVASRGLEARQRPGLSAVSRGRAAATQQAAQAPEDGRDATGTVRTPPNEPGLEHGLRFRSVDERAALSCADDRRRLQPRGSGDTGREAATR
jgi:putative transposase